MHRSEKWSMQVDGFPHHSNSFYKLLTNNKVWAIRCSYFNWTHLSHKSKILRLDCFPSLGAPSWYFRRIQVCPQVLLKLNRKLFCWRKWIVLIRLRYYTLVVRSVTLMDRDAERHSDICTEAQNCNDAKNEQTDALEIWTPYRLRV